MTDPNRPRRNQTSRNRGLHANVEEDQAHLDQSEGFLINTLTDLTVTQTLIQDHSREPSNFARFLDQRERVLRQAARLGGEQLYLLEMTYLKSEQGQQLNIED